jgi:hypothetical protein
MGYNPYDWGEQLNPDKINEKAKQIHSLLSKAYNYNNLLKRRLGVVNTAFECVSGLLRVTRDIAGTSADITKAVSVSGGTVDGNWTFSDWQDATVLNQTYSSITKVEVGASAGTLVEQAVTTNYTVDATTGTISWVVIHDNVGSPVSDGDYVFRITYVYDLSSEVPESYKAYNRPISTTKREIYIGGQAFFDPGLYTGLTLDASTDLVTDGTNLVLDLVADEVAISRIPLTTNQYGEKEPATGTTFTSSHFDERNLWLTLSPDGVWAEKTSANTGEFLIDLPDTLTPYLNRLKVTPIPGTQFRFYYATGGTTFQELTPENQYVRGTQFFYINKNIFNGNLKVQLGGQALGGGLYGYGINQIHAHYLPFKDTGTLKTKLTLPAAGGGTLTDVISGDLGDSIRIRISENDYAEAGDIKYDSDIDGSPYTGGTISFSATDLYLQIDMTKKDGTSPTLPFLILKYQPS